MPLASTSCSELESPVVRRALQRVELAAPRDRARAVGGERALLDGHRDRLLDQRGAARGRQQVDDAVRAEQARKALVIARLLVPRGGLEELAEGRVGERHRPVRGARAGGRGWRRAGSRSRRRTRCLPRAASSSPRSRRRPGAARARSRRAPSPRRTSGTPARRTRRRRSPSRAGAPRRCPRTRRPPAARAGSPRAARVGLDRDERAAASGASVRVSLPVPAAMSTMSGRARTSKCANTSVNGSTRPAGARRLVVLGDRAERERALRSSLTRAPP